MFTEALFTTAKIGKPSHWPRWMDKEAVVRVYEGITEP